MPQWLGIALSVLSFIAGAAATWLLLRVRFERFEAMDTRREQDWAKWRNEVDVKLAALNGGLLGRVARLEADVGDHDRGMRRDIREQTSALFRLDARVQTLEQE